MDKLWAPWRISYISSARKKTKECLFCSCRNLRHKKHLVFTTPESACILNIYPYNNGHLMVAPRRHVRSLAQLSDPEALDLFRALAHAQELLETVLRPDGFNIGINVSEYAGAGIPGHLHVHIVPRWKGDTNFMPVLAHTKIISQSLEALHTLLTHAHAKTHKKI